MHDSPTVSSWQLIAAGLLCAALFLSQTLPVLPAGSVIGTGQDEWYNMIRGLRMLYERLSPSYFIHPALYYELLAVLYGIERVVVGFAVGGDARSDYLAYFLANQGQFLDVARYATVACAALAVVAAVWLGALLAGAWAGLLAGLIVGSLPLLQAMATTIRVDALGLMTFIGAAALIVRWHQQSAARFPLAAAIGVGVAAAANYPGALLLIVLAWLAWTRASADSSARRASRVAAACAVAFATFLVLNPYVILDLRTFLRWFLFQAEMQVLIHPHAEDPSPTRYLVVLRDQGPAALAACIAALAAMLRPRQASGALAAFGLAYLAAFSFMQTQYDRFVLPAIVLLCIVGAAALCGALSRRLGGYAATGFVLIAGALVLWWSATRPRHIPGDPGPDYRAEMFEWIAQNVPSSATLIVESDTLPLLQTVYDPGADGRPFRIALQRAFEQRYPTLVRRVVKAQFIAAIYNYSPAQLDEEKAFFLASSQNRAFIELNRDVLAEPAAFYDALDDRATVVHEAGGAHEGLLLYVTKPTSSTLRSP